MKLPAIVFILALIGFHKEESARKIIPPGTVMVNDTLYVDKFEVDNVAWREYLYYLSTTDSVAYQKALPDTTVWSIKTEENGITSEMSTTLTEYYFRHPGYNNYPVVGVSYEQAIDYCKWRTYVANQGIYFKKNNIKDYKNHLSDSFPIYFYYRLPVKQEWERFASVGIDSSNKIFRKYYHKAEFYYNTKENSDVVRERRSHWMDYDFFISPTRSFFINKLGVYNMIGNVAEMIDEKGIAKGGSCIHPLKESQPNVDQLYSKPEQWLGFRCVAVMKK